MEVIITYIGDGSATTGRAQVAVKNHCVEVDIVMEAFADGQRIRMTRSTVPRRKGETARAYAERLASISRLVSEIARCDVQLSHCL